MKTMAKLRMAHASTHGARKPPGPKLQYDFKYLSITVLFIKSFETISWSFGKSETNTIIGHPALKVFK